MTFPAEQIAEKLWEKHAIDELVYGSERSVVDQRIDRDCFINALREYGEAVRQRAAGVCKKEHLENPSDSADDLAYDRAVRDCADAIERMELP